jgi:hypothetical protein
MKTIHVYQDVSASLTVRCKYHFQTGVMLFTVTFSH